MAYSIIKYCNYPDLKFFTSRYISIFKLLNNHSNIFRTYQLQTIIYNYDSILNFNQIYNKKLVIKHIRIKFQTKNFKFCTILLFFQSYQQVLFNYVGYVDWMLPSHPFVPSFIPFPHFCQTDQEWSSPDSASSSSKRNYSSF